MFIISILTFATLILLPAILVQISSRVWLVPDSEELLYRNSERSLADPFEQRRATGRHVAE